MLRLPTALLRHETRAGSHYDWLLGCPHWEPDPRARLWTVRVPWPSRAWSAARTWPAVELPPHRRLYLRYQGPISHGRGQVLRVDEGWLLACLWTQRRIILDVHLRHFTGCIELQRLGEHEWRVVVRP